MRKRWIVASVIGAALLIGGCSSNDTTKTVENIKQTKGETSEVKEKKNKEVSSNKKTASSEEVEVMIKTVKNILKENMGDSILNIDVFEKNGGIFIDINPFSGFALSAMTTGNSDYKAIIENFKTISKVTQESFKNINHDTDVTLLVRNDQNYDKTLLTIMNGDVVYDFTK